MAFGFSAARVEIVYWGNIGIMEKRMETTIVYLGYIGEGQCFGITALFEAHPPRLNF